MLQFPAFMRQFPSPTLIPSSSLLPPVPCPRNEETFLSIEEAEYEEKMSEIRKANSNVVVIGKAAVEYKEEADQEAEEEDGDNVEESDGDEFEQEIS